MLCRECSTEQFLSIGSQKVFETKNSAVVDYHYSHLAESGYSQYATWNQITEFLRVNSTSSKNKILWTEMNELFLGDL